MNVSCPECRSVFRVDPGRIPGASVRARCAVCGGVITISREGATPDEFTPATGKSGVGTPSRAATPAASPLAARPANPAAAAPHFGSAPTPPIGQMANRATPVAGGTQAPVPPAQATPAVPPPAAPPQPRMTVPPRLSGAISLGTAANASTYGRPSGAFLPAANPTPAAVPRVPGPAAPLAPASATGAPSPMPPRPQMPPMRPPAGPAAGTPAPAPVPPPVARPSVAPVATPAASPPPQPPTAAPTPPRPALGGSASGARPINPFLANDPNAKARRLARALISDLISYFPQKKEEGLRNGTLKQLFGEEIKKSYEEFVGQIGREFAESTTHFTDALNDILANGQKVFEGNRSGVE